jgi:polar amino acid transport system substrate-binding protein
MRTYLKILLGAIVLCSMAAATYAEVIKVGFGVGKPPFVFEITKTGIEVEIARKVLASSGNVLEPVFMPNLRIIEELKNGRIKIGSALPNDPASGLHFAGPLVTFENFAITQTQDNIKIASISDLARCGSIAAWQNARGDLGKEFTDAVKSNKEYNEIPSQKNQVEVFYQKNYKVIIIDKTIFYYWLKENKFSAPEQKFTFHPIFSTKTSLYAGFTDTEQAKKFDDGIKKLKSDGDYDKIISSFIN